MGFIWMMCAHRCGFNYFRRPMLRAELATYWPRASLLFYRRFDACEGASATMRAFSNKSYAGRLRVYVILFSRGEKCNSQLRSARVEVSGKSYGTQHAPVRETSRTAMKCKSVIYRGFQTNRNVDTHHECYHAFNDG